MLGPRQTQARGVAPANEPKSPRMPPRPRVHPPRPPGAFLPGALGNSWPRRAGQHRGPPCPILLAQHVSVPHSGVGENVRIHKIWARGRRSRVAVWRSQRTTPRPGRLNSRALWNVRRGPAAATTPRGPNPRAPGRCPQPSACSTTTHP